MWQVRFVLISTDVKCEIPQAMQEFEERERERSKDGVLNGYVIEYLRDGFQTFICTLDGVVI